MALNNARDRHYFSMADVLVVLTLIAAVAVLVLPLITYTSKVSSKGQCASNMGKLAKAFTLYMADSDGKLPYWFDATATWDTYLGRYVRNKRIFVCPANTADRDNRPYPRGVLIRSYAMPKNISGVKAGQAPKPGLTVLLYEKGECPLGDPGAACGEYYDQIGGGRSAIGWFWHGDGKNFAFLDGHVGYWRVPYGPFQYNYPDFVVWSTTRFAKNPGGPGYCGWADKTTGAGLQIQSSTTECLPGANIPQ